MGMVEVSTGRASVSSAIDGLTIVIPSARNWFLILFLFAWLGMWCVGEKSVAESLMGPHETNDGFLFFWLVGWTVAGFFAATTWLWNVAGKEVLVVGRGALTYKRMIGPFGLTKQYDLNHVKDLRVVPLDSRFAGLRGFNAYGNTGGSIAFDYGAKTIRLGAGVEEAEAKMLVEKIKQRCKF